ncbi:MAG TPA: protein-disulfide reductase DsbD [Steroidobacteraceae bacterium]|nr:protein-disulfide reductase DsbD [Steroidobacteraceae bacterium]
MSAVLLALVAWLVVAGTASATTPAILNGSSNSDEFLRPDDAFSFSGEVTGPNTLHLRWVIADGYYLYKAKIKTASDSQLVQLGAPDLPQGDEKTDEYFGTQQVYHQQLEVDVPFSRASPAGANFDAKVTYQGCADAGLCYPPITKTLKLSLPAIDASALKSSSPTSGGVISEQDRLARLIQSGSLLLVLATFFGLGLLLSLTPCVLPMVPILSGIIASHGNNVTARKAFALSLAYVLGMAVTYTVAGAAFAAAGQQAQAIFQQTWILVLFALLFVALALAMFGLYELQVPAAIQTRLAGLSNQQKAGSYVGTAVMGALSALIVTTCVAPPLVATFVVIGQAGDVVRGALALFALSIGMGTPLLLVGASAGKLLPKAGAWMDTVKRFFGVLFLGVAIWMIQRVLPGPAALAAWGLLLLVAVFVLGAFRSSQPVSGARWLGRGVSAAAAFWGVLMLVGAAGGNTDPFQPLKGMGGARTSAATVSGPEFKLVHSVADLDRELAAAKAAGRPAMLDFSAEWCVSCKEMEKYTFPDPKVRAVLTPMWLLRADVTENNAEDQALLKRFGIFGPPTIAFFGPDGLERQNFRLVGYVKADKFSEHVAQAIASPAT